MTREELIRHIRNKKSYLLVGLDTDIEKIPNHLLTLTDPVFEFNKQIIDATEKYCVGYKINTAFYESMGVQGWNALEKTVGYIPESHFTIADAKRGDIGNTSSHYAKAFFDHFGFDAITVNPYMGSDSVQPFLEYKNKWTIVLGLTSNKGSHDFEQLKTGERFVYEKVIETVSGWGSPENLMFVVGATKAIDLASIRKIIPDHFLLVPGVGAQGGSLEEVSQKGFNKDCGLLVNASRAIIYASDKHDFAEAAANAAAAYQMEMKVYF